MGEGQSKPAQLDPNQPTTIEESTKKKHAKKHKHSRSNPDPLDKKKYTKRSESILSLKRRKESMTNSESNSLHNILTRKNLKKKRRSKSATGDPLTPNMITINSLDTASLNDDTYEKRRKQILISSKSSLNSSVVLLNRSDYLLSNHRKLFIHIIYILYQYLFHQ